MVEIPSDVAGRFAAFHIDALQQFRVRVRRQRAEQLRELLSRPADLTLEIFNHDVWRLETQALVNETPIPSGEIFDIRGMSESRRIELEDALDHDRLTFHGNAIWGSGTRIYGSSVRESNDDKLAHIRVAARVLTDASLAPLAKAEQLVAIPGFGPNVSTGLVLVFHPSEFTLWNEVSRAVVGSWDGRTAPLAAFEEDAEAIRAALGADDFLELDWFFYLSNRERRASEPAARTGEPSYWALMADPRRYDIVGALRDQEFDQWKTGGSALAVGDRLAFWKAKGNEETRGVVCLRVVTSAPYVSTVAKSQPWIIPPDDDKPEPRVDVRYVPLPAGPLWLEEYPFLGELSVARSRGTTFRITPSQWDQLMAAIGGWPERELRSVWWVNQSASFKHERAGGYLWAPLVDKVGRPKSHWETLARARVGDVASTAAYRAQPSRRDGSILRTAADFRQFRDRLLARRHPDVTGRAPC
jgi:hypothetical protein